MSRDHSIRLGKTMDFTSQDGVNHPESFWCLDDLRIPIGESAIRLEFVGYHNVESYDNNGAAIAGAKKIYQFSNERYMNSINMPTQFSKGNPISREILEMAWATAIAEKDTEGETPRSFFETAVSVQ